MVNFLVTVVLAILIFGGATAIIAKVLGVDQQAKQNFYKLDKELREFAQSDKDLSGFLMILDEESYVAKFTKDTNLNLLVLVRRTPIGTSVSPVPVEPIDESQKRVYQYPSQCAGKDCLVLCKKLAMIDDTWTVRCDEALILPVSEKFIIEPFLVIRTQKIDYRKIFDYNQKVISTEGDNVIEITGAATARRVQVNVVRKEKRDDGRNYISISGSSIQ